VSAVLEAIGAVVVVAGLVVMVSAAIALTERDPSDEIRTSQGRRLPVKKSAGAVAAARRTTHRR
jgi:hypothetical protein